MVALVNAKPVRLRIWEGRSRTEDYFRKRLKAERQRREWSQSDIAKLLSENRIPMHPTTIAKIEAGDRSVRIDEATGIADLLGLSLDGLLGRKGMEDERSHAMTVLAEEARKLIPEVIDIVDRLRRAYQELEAQFDFAGFEQHIAKGRTWDFDGMTLEHQRAMVMWAGRDMALTELNKVLMGLTGVVAFRSMTPRELAAQLAQMEATLTEHAEELRAVASMKDSQIEYAAKQGQEADSGSET